MNEADQNEQQIRRLLAEYCFHCDDGKFDQLVDCFTTDAEFVFGGHVKTGHAAMRRFFEATGAPEMRGKHMQANIVIEIHGTTASALSDYVFFGWVGLGLIPQYAGRYRDDLRFDNGRWKLSRRQVISLER